MDDDYMSAPDLPRALGPRQSCKHRLGVELGSEALELEASRMVGTDDHGTPDAIDIGQFDPLDVQPRHFSR